MSPGWHVTGYLCSHEPNDKEGTSTLEPMSHQPPLPRPHAFFFSLTGHATYGTGWMGLDSGVGISTEYPVYFPKGSQYCSLGQGPGGAPQSHQKGV